VNHLSNNTLFVISAFKGNNLKADVVYTEELNDILKDRNDTYVRSEGKWDGKEEEVFIISAPSGVGNDVVRSALLELAECFNQECIAEIDSNNALLYLHYLNGKTECAGNFRLGSEEPAGDYTKINGLYLTLTN
jgi:hypothetical protein